MESSGIASINSNDYVYIDAKSKDQNLHQQEIINSIDFELRTPVTIMKSNIQLLKKCCIGSDHSTVEESFLLCEDAVDDILRFINSINFLSETNQGKLKLKKKRFNLYLFLTHVIEELRQSNYDVSRINVDFAVSEHNITTDKYLLNRILINLLVNALKFSASTIELYVSIINDQLIVVVRDYGIGIPEDEIPEIFNPFVRASNGIMIRGTGLGLSIVSKAVDCLQGSLYVNSIVGKGSEFVFIIPIEPAGEFNSRVKKINDLKLNTKVQV